MAESSGSSDRKPDYVLAKDAFKSVSAAAPANVPGQAVLLAHLAMQHNYDLSIFQIHIFNGGIQNLVDEINAEHAKRGVHVVVERGKTEEVLQNVFRTAIALNSKLNIRQLEELKAKVLAQRSQGLSIDARVTEINLAIEPLLHPEAYVSHPQ